jgi:hypothetical protein
MNTELDFQNYQNWLVDKCVYENSSLTIDLVAGVESEVKQDLDLGGGSVIKDVYAVERVGVRFRVYFEDVVFLQIFDECAHLSKDDEFRDKGVIGQYSSSKLLDYVKSETLVMDVVPGTLMHIEVMTGDDWFHVLTRKLPSVSRIENA